MQIPLPPELENTLDTAQVRLDLAVGMYAARRVTLGRGAEIAGLSQMAFQRELGQRKIPMHYNLADLTTDLQAVHELTKQ